MKALIFNGSPRKNGDTSYLVKILTKNLAGKVKIVMPYFDNIKPCVDCRYCWQNEGCIINDDMQEVFKYLISSDNIIIASPLYFSEITGELLSALSRLQTIWCAKFFRRELV